MVGHEGRKVVWCRTEGLKNKVMRSRASLSRFLYG
jgi:hypothetical protein